MIFIMVLLVMLVLFGLYMMMRPHRQEAKQPVSHEEFKSDMQYVAGEIKKLYEERARLLAENDRLKRDLEALRKRLGPFDSD